MLYRVLKIWVGLAARIFCRRIRVSRPALLEQKGPLLLAVNHPNSFLDAVLLDLLFDQPVWSLARGDVFKKKNHARFLHRLKILPVYRTSEGTENLEINYKTFAACKAIFEKQGIVLMFSEGKCINEWHLRPLKKGTARLAMGAWDAGIPLEVLPIGINYNSFRLFGKNVFIQMGPLITQEDFPVTDTDGKRHILFNERLRAELEKLVYEIPQKDLATKKRLLTVPQPVLKKIVLALPAAAGWLLNAPLYLPLRFFVNRKVKETDHFDSVSIALLSLLYPLYVLLVTAICFWITGSAWSLMALFLLPFSAWAFVQVKRQVD